MKHRETNCKPNRQAGFRAIHEADLRSSRRSFPAKQSPDKKVEVAELHSLDHPRFAFRGLLAFAFPLFLSGCQLVAEHASDVYQNSPPGSLIWFVGIAVTVVAGLLALRIYVFAAVAVGALLLVVVLAGQYFDYWEDKRGARLGRYDWDVDATTFKGHMTLADGALRGTRLLYYLETGQRGAIHFNVSHCLKDGGLPSMKCSGVALRGSMQDRVGTFELICGPPTGSCSLYTSYRGGNKEHLRLSPRQEAAESINRRLVALLRHRG